MGNFHAIIITNQFWGSVQRCLRAEMLLKSAKKRRKEKAITAAKLVASIRQNVDGDERYDPCLLLHHRWLDGPSR